MDRFSQISRQSRHARNQYGAFGQSVDGWIYWFILYESTWLKSTFTIYLTEFWKLNWNNLHHSRNRRTIQTSVMSHIVVYCATNWNVNRSTGTWKTFIRRNSFRRKTFKHTAGAYSYTLRTKYRMEDHFNCDSFSFSFSCRFSAVNADLCLDDLQQDNESPFNLGIYTCHHPDVTRSQFFSLTNSGVLRNELSCASIQQRFVYNR